MKQNISIKTYLQKCFKNLYLIFWHRPFIDKKSSARGVNICLQVSLWVFVLAYFVIFIQDVPKPLSELKTFYGKMGKMSFDSKSSLGTMIFILDDNSYKKISIYKDKKDIYDKVINKKVKIYTISDKLLPDFIAQLEDMDGNIYIKYNFDTQIGKHNSLLKFNNFILFMIFFTIFLIFIVNRKDNKQSPPNPQKSRIPKTKSRIPRDCFASLAITEF